VKVPPKSQNVSIIESDHVSPLKKELALCLHQIKKARKWQPRAREKLEKGRCGFELSVTVLMKLFGPTYSGLPSASVFSSLQTEQFYNKSFCFYYLSSIRGRLSIVVFLVQQLLSVAEDFLTMTIKQINTQFRL